MESDGVIEGQWVMLGIAMGSRGATQSSRGTPRSRIVIGIPHHFRVRVRDAHGCECRNTAHQKPCRYSAERCGIGGLQVYRISEVRGATQICLCKGVQDCLVGHFLHLYPELIDIMSSSSFICHDAIRFVHEVAFSSLFSNTKR